MNLTFFKKLAIVEGISFLVILFITMPLKYVAEMPMPNKFVGMIHGVLFIYYVIGVFLIKDKASWTSKDVLIALVASILPFGTFYVERKMLD
ncbi:MAG: DUF3817 domain-containing protein [Chitinophagales bacterium]|jgi:integral membrane protein|nr:DUF3817 domain-containing protein [Chitinophagales bacterium]